MTQTIQTPNSKLRNTPDLGGAGYFADPYAVLNRLRAESPVFWSTRLKRWVITRYDDVLTVLRDTARFSSNVVPQIPPHERVPALAGFVNLSSQWLFFLDPPAHGPQRALVARHFTPHTAQALAPLIRQTAGELLEKRQIPDSKWQIPNENRQISDENRQASNAKWQILDEIDLLADYAHPLAARVIAELLCATEADRTAFLGWCRDLEAASLAARERAARQRGFQAIVAATDYLKQRVTELPLPRRILESVPDANVESVTAHSLVLLFAGVETTQNLIGNLVHALLQHPVQLELARNEPTLVAAAVEEGLRYDAPVLGVVRRVTADTELRGVHLCAGDEMAVMIGAANRDPSHFNTPDAFDLQRTEQAHLAFGNGRHYCTGAALARLTANIALEVLLEKCGELELAATNLRWRDHDPIVRGLKTLPLRMG